MVLGSTALLLAAAGSIWGCWDTHRDLASGRPTYLSLADYTGFWDRTQLEEWYGPANAQDRFSLSSEQLRQLPRTLWNRWFDDLAFDIAGIAAALAVPFLLDVSPPWAIGLLVVFGGLQLAAYLRAAYLVGEYYSPADAD